jgi:hypothetical protein
VTVYDAATRTATFAATGIFPNNTKIKVLVSAQALTNQTQVMWMDYNWSFTTQSLAPINIYLKKKTSSTKVCNDSNKLTQISVKLL